MRVFDHDLREVFLGGLDLSYVPSKARHLVRDQSITPYPDEKVQGQLRAIAICLHKHQNLMPWARPASQSQDQFTQSFPVGARGYPRDTDTDNSFSAADYTQLADEAQDAIRPFTDTEPLLGSSYSPQAVRPSLHSTVTSPDAKEVRKFRKTRGGHQTQQPLLPEPEFISPRPATKQRYVSAGGNAKLHERQEIEGPAFSFHTGGASMSKDEVDHKLKDRDFIRSTFGSAAAEMAISAERSSRESAGRADKRESKAGSSKKSKDEVGKYQKRGKGESGASKGNAAATLAKLKKKFSRKGSECE
ncbi:hypothetical protein KC332_g12664 [Hortaea werneckii]|nr:hypothetical protein KC358_g12637 [Hortaea werneckii]KAI6811235.1 hypothetical protein KC350_g12289 [Hortaea werneckii]KAI6911880.1 hypothetical protein KC348_g12824 [Hortaea werneckii]KAI6926735.1 hypothetical protein KC341_g12603 [Hortaea werneckii]KAI6960695.1 hypothetical protein KC321_g12723 [Hortaea werneckii]